MSQTRRAITVTLGDLQKRVDERVRSGAYASASEVLREALRALDHQEAITTEWMRAEVRRRLHDPRPSAPSEEVVARVRAHIASKAPEDPA